MGGETTIFRVHALKRMARRNISEMDVQHVIETGVTIESYPDDRPYPSPLLFGWSGHRPIHVVVANNADERQTIVIAVYEPDTERWDPNFIRRKRQ
jgi:hypothetical protein